MGCAQTPYQFHLVASKVNSAGYSQRERKCQEQQPHRPREHADFLIEQIGAAAE